MERWAYKFLLVVTLAVFLLAVFFLAQIPLSLLFSYSPFLLGWYFGPLFTLLLLLMLWVLSASRSSQMDLPKFLGRS